MRKSATVAVFTLAVFLSACGQGQKDPRANRVRLVLRARKANRGRPALPQWREQKASKVSPARKGHKGSKDLPVPKALKEIRDRPADNRLAGPSLRLPTSSLQVVTLPSETL